MVADKSTAHRENLVPDMGINLMEGQLLNVNVLIVEIQSETNELLIISSTNIINSRELEARPLFRSTLLFCPLKVAIFNVCIIMSTFLGAM